MAERAKLPRADPTAAPGAVPVHEFAAAVTPTLDRGVFTSRWTYLAAVIGAAIGFVALAEVPLASLSHGGSAYLILFLVTVVVVGFPLVVAEFALGRTGQRNPVGAFRYLENDYRTPWKFAGYLFVFAASLFLAFYAVVTGWVLRYALAAGGSGFADAAAFREKVATGPDALGFHLFVMVLVLVIAYPPIKRGAQWFFAGVVPLSFVLMLVALAMAVGLHRAQRAYYQWIIPHFEKLGVDGVIAAVLSAVFAFTVGVGVLLTYTSYTPKTTSHATNGLVVVGSTFVLAAIAALMIVPVFHASGVSSTGVDGLFVGLPAAFAALGGTGKTLGILFFGSLFLAALATAVALAEPAILFLAEELKVGRRRAVLFAIPAIYTLGIPAAFSSTAMSVLMDLTKALTLVGLLGVLVYNSIFTPKERTIARFDETLKGLRLGKYVHFVVRWVLPFIIVFLLAIVLVGTPCALSGDAPSRGILESFFKADMIGCRGG